MSLQNLVGLCHQIGGINGVTPNVHHKLTYSKSSVALSLTSTRLQLTGSHIFHDIWIFPQLTGQGLPILSDNNIVFCLKLGLYHVGGMCPCRWMLGIFEVMSHLWEHLKVFPRRESLRAMGVNTKMFKHAIALHRAHPRDLRQPPSHPRQEVKASVHRHLLEAGPAFALRLILSFHTPWMRFHYYPEPGGSCHVQSHLLARARLGLDPGKWLQIV
jgi:hypothetical protein